MSTNLWHYLTSAILELDHWCEEHKIPEHHGLKHALVVLNNASLALRDFDLTSQQQLCVLLASLLHDQEDRKFVKSQNLEGTRSLLLRIGLPLELIETVLEMIRLVSCSKNANTANASVAAWYYIPRDADRIEAIGSVGIRRAHDTTVEFAKQGLSQCSFWTEQTPRPTTREELAKVATLDRLEKYRTQGGFSASLIDHCYDKLLHIHQLSSGSTTLQRMADGRREVMVEFVLEFGRTGVIDWKKYL